MTCPPAHTIEPKLGLKAGVGGGIFREDGFGLGGHVEKGAGDCVKLRRALESDKLLLTGIDALPLPNLIASAPLSIAFENLDLKC